MSNRAFLSINAVVWSFYTALNLFLFTTFVGVSSGMVAISVLLGVSGFVMTTLTRRIAHARGWLDRDLLPLGVRIVAAVLIGATLMQLVVATGVIVLERTGAIAFPGKGSDFRPGAVLGYWLNTVLLVGGWSVAWLGTRAVRRARQGELTRLRMEAEHRALELDALRARLNPHFVFNALNNLRALINEDTERARELVTRLSNTLRHALDHHAQGDVTLAEELAVIDDYLAVESVHYEQRLRVVREIDPAALPLRLPAMLLQLLVENAIKHGIARTAGGGELRIAARVVEGALQIDVDNPGTLGAAEDDPHARDPEARRGGVGLAYLRAQLARDACNRFALDQEGPRVHARMTIAQIRP